MKKLSVLSAALALVIVSFTGGAWWTRRGTGDAAQAQKAVVYACPMHPQYRSDHPGDCPSCGMRLEPVRGGTPGADDAGRALPPGAVRVSAERQQAVGVRLGVAERVLGTRMLRTTGRVAPNENATYPIVAGVSGWIREVRAATTGSQVRKHEVLASFYAPEFVLAQQSYFTALDTIERSSQLPAQQLATQQRVIEGVQRYADTLRNLGVSEEQLQDIAKKRALVQDIYISAPVDGFVLQRNVSLGLRFDRGFEFYRIADLRSVWILADVYQHQLPFVRPGATARITTYEGNREYVARVSTAEPIFDEATLTLKVRLETANPGLLLKPGMFVDVEFPIELPSALAVPADAIVDSGLRKTVYVDKGQGYFEPRQVETGWRLGDQVEVTKGLMPGERIVISGTFLIDSESRMKAAAQGIFGAAAEDPVCGMQVDEKRAAAAGRMLAHGGKHYFFCADDCKRAFEKDPGRYVKPAMPGPPGHTAAPAPAATPASKPAASAAVAVDPVCSMEVTIADAVAAGRTSQRDGRTYYFCADECKKQFDETRK